MKRFFRLGVPVKIVPGSVVKEWLSELSMMQQTVVLEMLRGCDGTSKNDPTKLIIRFLRKCVLHRAGNGSFMDVDMRILLCNVKEFFEDCDKYPLHFVMHLIHAAEVIGYKHPDKEVAEFWKNFYLDLCHTIHINPESEKEMDKRLRDGRDEAEHGKRYRLVDEWKDKGEEVVKKMAEAMEKYEREDPGRGLS